MVDCNMHSTIEMFMLQYNQYATVQVTADKKHSASTVKVNIKTINMTCYSYILKVMYR